MRTQTLDPRSPSRAPSSLSQLVAVAIWALGAVLSGCQPPTDESPVLVIVNSKPITQDEFEFRWAELPPAAQERYRRDGGRRKFLDDLVSRELLLQEARKQGLDRSPTAVERLERLKEQMAMEELVRATVTTQVQATPEEVEAYFAAHEAELRGTELVRVAHIVVRSVALARELKQQLDHGADFAVLAQRFSMDQMTRFRGGDLGLLRPGTLGRELSAALGALKPGMVSEPVESQDGVHLVKLVSREPDQTPAAEATRQRLRQELYAEKQRRRFEEYLAQLRSSATIRLADLSRSVTEDSGRPPADPATK